MANGTDFVGFRSKGKKPWPSVWCVFPLNLFPLHSDMTACGTTAFDSSLGLEIRGHLQFVILD